jgi:hypothetical protein
VRDALPTHVSRGQHLLSTRWWACLVEGGPIGAHVWHESHVACKVLGCGDAAAPVKHARKLHVIFAFAPGVSRYVIEFVTAGVDRYVVPFVSYIV